MHTATHWQIALATDPTFAAPVVSTITLTELVAALLIGLIVGTNYLIRARYMDEEGNWSDWGPATPFTTLAANTEPEPGSEDFTAWEACTVL